MLITDQVATTPCTDPVQAYFLTFRAKLTTAERIRRARLALSHILLTGDRYRWNQIVRILLNSLECGA
jgi:hypothetical protein